MNDQCSVAVYVLLYVCETMFVFHPLTLHIVPYLLLRYACLRSIPQVACLVRICNITPHILFTVKQENMVFLPAHVIHI